MARQREATSVRQTAYAEKHDILVALEKLATPENWSQFKEIRRAYKKFRNDDKDGDRYDRKQLLQDCEDKGLIKKEEHALIQQSWDAHLEPILAGMEQALARVRKGDKLSCWIGYEQEHDGVNYRRNGKLVMIDIHTRKKPWPGPWKGLFGMDPGFFRRLEAHHREIGAALEAFRADVRRRKKGARPQAGRGNR